MTTQQMIEALSKSKNELVARKCQRILNQDTTIEAELKWSGSFMTYVMQGDFKMALQTADLYNRNALLDACNKYDFRKKSSVEDDIIGKPMQDYINEKHNQDECVGFIDGYNKAREKFKFSQEELIWAIQEAYGHGQDDEDYTVKESIYAILKYLSQNEIVK